MGKLSIIEKLAFALLIMMVLSFIATIIAIFTHTYPFDVPLGVK